MGLKSNNTGARHATASQANSQLRMRGVSKLHSVVFFNNTGADAWIHVMILASEADPGTAPTLPPVLVQDGQTGALDYGSSGRPVRDGYDVFVAPSSTQNTYTEIEAQMFFDVTYS